MSLSVIIPSKKISNLRASVAAVRGCEPSLPIIVVDDGVDWSGAEEFSRGLIVTPGSRPFSFARNCNIGIREAGKNDVVLLNDDALLKTTNGFSVMQEQWSDNREFGLIGAALDYCGTPEQIRQGEAGLRELPVMAVFACVFIPRQTIASVGLLDERFGVNAGGPGVRGYGCEDYDYCKRVRRAGLKLAVSDSCFVSHTELPSTFRHRDRAPGEARQSDVRLHERLILEKWGEKPYV